MNHNSVGDIAQAAAEYAEAHFDTDGAGTQHAQWVAPVDDVHRLGMGRNLEDGSLLLTAWRQVINDHPDADDVRGQALMRHTFDTRLGAGLVGGISPQSGYSLSLPLYTACGAQALQTAAEFLLWELNSLSQEDTASVMPVVAGDARATLGDASQAERSFARLAQACNAPPPSSSLRSFDLLFGDLPGRVSLHPSNRLVLLDFFLYDAIALMGSLRRMVIKSALEISQAALSGHAFAVGLDSRDFITSTGRIALQQLDDDTWPRWLQYQVEQAFATRDLIKNLSLDNAQILYAIGDSVLDPTPGALA